VPTTDLAEGCLRSDGNYPSLLAEALDVDEVRDVSCSAAETPDVARPQQVAGGQGTVPPQIRAVDQDTALVTVGIGGNDEDLFASLVGCVGGFGPDSGAEGAAPDAPPNQPCLDPDDNGPAEVIARTGDRVETVLRSVRRRAPGAEVVLVGYPRLLGDTTGCAAFPVRQADLAAARALERALSRSLESAAARAGTSYLDVYALSEGHEICSDDPWVNGRETDQARALAFHPFAEGQQAIADALAEELSG
jgi:lysophospholipase L1-like esterase